MLSFYGNGAAAGDGSTAKQLWERGDGENSIQQIINGEDVTQENKNHATGMNAVAVGNGSTASGYSSFVQGSYCLANEDNAHAEGSESTASGAFSHAEGANTLASSYSAHAEGYSTIADGSSAHAEGTRTISSGNQSHAEGIETKAKGMYSHAQNYYTVAASTAQTALGKYNIEDNQNQYAVIIGNGTASNACSNALTVDWNGNVNIAGNLTYNGGQTLSSSLPVVETEQDPSVGTYFYYNGDYDHPLTWGNLAVNPYLLSVWVDMSSYGDSRSVYVSNYTCIEENGEYNLYYIVLDNFINGYIIFDRVKFTFSSETATVASSRFEDRIQVAFGAYNN